MVDFVDDLLGPLLGVGATAGAGLLTKEAYDRLQTVGETATTLNLYYLVCSSDF